MEEKDKEKKLNLSKKQVILIITISVLLLIIIVFFCIKLFIKKETFQIEPNFLEIGKKYYNDNSTDLPIEIGECSNITLEILLSEGLIEEPENYGECNKYDTKLKVCKIDDNRYQYVPLLVCDSVNSEDQYSEWKVGTTKDLIVDSSDVDFLFLGYERVETEPQQELTNWEDEITIDDYEIISTKKYYRYRDKEWQWQEINNKYFTENDIGDSIFAYYAVKPNEEYVNSDSETTAYKWYTMKNIGANSYRMYLCKSDVDNSVIWSNEACENRIDDYDTLEKEIFTCGVQDESKNYLEVSENIVCDCTSKELGSNCEKKKSYYPSGSDNANKENVYYAVAPINNAIKDVSTKLNVSRYYKEENIITEKYYSKSPSSAAIKVGNGKWGDWTDYSTSKPKEYDTREIEIRQKITYQLSNEDTDDNWKKISEQYIPLEEFIEELKKLDYDVDSLEEINNHRNLKYEVQLKYRNKNKQEEL